MKMKWLRFTTLWLTGVLLAALVCGVCSCSSFSGQKAEIIAHTTPYAGAPPQPPTQPANVRVLRFEPTQPCQKIGEIVLIIPPDGIQSKEQVNDKLREEAAKLGADGVFVADDHFQPYGADLKYEWDMDSEIEQSEKVVAKAIKLGTLPATGREP